MGIARMVAGGAAGGMDEGTSPAKADDPESVLNEIKGLIKPAAKKRVSDAQASNLAAQADAAGSSIMRSLGGGYNPHGGVRPTAQAPAPMPMRGIAHAAAPSNQFAPVAGSMGAGEYVREDGTMKGQGFFGPLQHSSGRGATELSVSEGPPASFPYTHKDEILYPSMVPTLSREELETMMAGDRFPKSIYDKSYAHARGRLAQGKSPFAQVGEQYPAPGYEQQFMQQYPSAVMSYPDRTVGYQYAAGAPVTSYMSPVASRPVPKSAIMSMARKR